MLVNNHQHNCNITKSFLSVGWIRQSYHKGQVQRSVPGLGHHLHTYISTTIVYYVLAYTVHEHLTYGIIELTSSACLIPPYTCLSTFHIYIQMFKTVSTISYEKANIQYIIHCFTSKGKLY